MTRVLGVDHGEKRIGVAVSDESGTIARALTEIAHTARAVDAARVAELAREHGAGLIVVGQSFDEDGQPNAAGRRAARFAEELRRQSGLPVVLWDEAFSTEDARQARRALGVSRRRRAGHLDSLAAAVILQSYLDAHA